MTLASPTSRWILGVLFIVLGALHFVRPEFYLQIMPPYLPWHLELVYLSGLFEILGGIGVLVRPLRQVARWGLIALLVAVFPANIQMTVDAFGDNGTLAKQFISVVRLPFQPFFIYWVWAACQPSHSGRGLRGSSLEG